MFILIFVMLFKKPTIWSGIHAEEQRLQRDLALVIYCDPL